MPQQDTQDETERESPAKRQKIGEQKQVKNDTLKQNNHQECEQNKKDVAPIQKNNNWQKYPKSNVIGMKHNEHPPVLREKWKDPNFSSR